ncbi:MAG: D-2-hydroxyacid dehydrogenase [Bryobacterales bacterium]|nr:D-2-hydroxyacid dehydrogenase [Bryobacterales bacterium]
MKLVVLDGYCLNPGDLSWDALRQFAEVEVHDRTPAADVVSRVGDAELAMTNKTPLDAAALARLPQLRYIGVLATGYNIVDIAAAKTRGIIVTNIPTYGTASVAQHAFALLLELCHHVGVHGESVRGGEWSKSADWCYWKAPLMELAGKTMGVIGFGRIGRQTAKIADAMGMRVIANDTFEGHPPAYEGFRFASVEEVLRESDVISLHCPLTPENKGLINAQRLRLMKPSAFLLNTSRGPLVVDEDLAAALDAGVIAGAGLDVLSVEPPAAGNPLFAAKNCIVTPHIAWATREARARLMDIAVSNVAAFLHGAAVNVVG